MEMGLCEGDPSSLARPSHWHKDSHCSGEDGNYAKIFDALVVHRIDIEVSAANYQAQIDDLTSILGSPGMMGGGGRPMGGGGGRPMGGGMDQGQDPIWVPVTLRFDGREWTQVGMRYKGNSSLRSAWGRGVLKLAFRLSFDKYENDYPELDDQRFYGFKKMTFSNGFSDPSMIRDRLAADMFRDGGVPAARGAFVRVYVDFGQGSTYYGLYSMIEDVSNRMLDTQFNDDGGNLYKPEGEGATWSNLNTGHFDKKTNANSSDWSDVIGAYNALHASRANAPQWRSAFEATFNVEQFLKCLAINQSMTNWDSYGMMNHNYYIYADPSDGGRFAWIPWDLNEAMLIKSRDGAAESIMLDQVDNQWPLIRFLLDDSVYRAQYRVQLQAALDGPLETTALFQKMDAYHNLIAPYVVGTSGESAPYTFLNGSAEFEDSLDATRNGLKPHIRSRVQAVQQELAR